MVHQLPSLTLRVTKNADSTACAPQGCEKAPLRLRCGLRPHALNFWLLAASAVFLIVLTKTSAATDLRAVAQLRRPVALALSASGDYLLVANRTSGTISTVHVQTSRVVTEVKLAGHLTDLVRLDREARYLALDDVGHQLVVFRADRGQISPLATLDISPYPQRVVVAEDRQACFVTSLWSRRLNVIDLTDPLQPSLSKTIDLPFAPRALCLLPDQQTLVVAAAFGGGLATVDVATGQLLRSRMLHAHNIHNLVVDEPGERLLIPHQKLESDAETTLGGVHWGDVLTNVIRSLPIAALSSDSWPPARDLYYLGHPDDATGDPNDLVLTSGGRQLVSYSGTAEVAVSDRGGNYFTEVPVGRRPTDLLLSSDEKHVWVANTFSDSVTRIEVEGGQPVSEISLGRQPELTAAGRGELLFYDAGLSDNGWFSCHSCHTDGHSSGLLSDNLSDGGFGAPKRILSLLGTAGTGPWAWNGQTEQLPDQVRKSIELTMRGDRPSEQQVADLTAYLRTLEPAPGIAHFRAPHGAASARPGWQRGRHLFHRYECTSCHEPENFTSTASFDVELSDEVGNASFNPPFLRGVSQRGRLLHDNRASDLRDLLLRLGHGVTESISPQDMADLVGYLESL